MSEFVQFQSKYPQILFNDQPPKRSASWFFLVETMPIYPHAYDLNILKQYKGVFTWNSKLHDILLKEKINSVLINGFPLFDNNFWLNDFTSYDKKDGICLICRWRKSNHQYDISEKRVEVFQALNHPIKHCYGKVPYCDDLYCGVIGQQTHETYPSSLEKLRVLNKYKFCVCFENVYHELWSWDYITEKIFDCFRAKTIPIYYGCFNIEEHIPKEFYIDYRDFKSNEELSEYLKTFDRNKYLWMIDAAYEFVKTTQYGNVEDLERQVDYWINEKIRRVYD